MSDLEPSSSGPRTLVDVFADAMPASDLAERHAALLAVTSALLTESPSELTIGRYHVVEKIGAGGMGVVYLAHDPQLQRKVALKFVGNPRHNASGRAREQARLLQEGQALARLSHPNVVPVYDAGLFHEQVFLAMEYIEGETLTAWQSRTRPSPRQVLEVFLAAGRGLAAAHAAAIIHRDFKPANVIVGADGRVRVLDFGLARSTGSETTSTLAPAAALPSALPPSDVAGTPAYMAPEQEDGGEVGVAADQFSFCVALYEALTGARPFLGTTVQALHDAKRAGVTTGPRALSRRARRALLRGLACDPAQRWPTIGALLGELEHDLQRPRWFWRWAALALVGGGAAIFAAVRGAAPEDPGACTAATAAALVDVWDAPLRVQVGKAFLASGVPHAVDSWQRVTTRLDAYAARWTAVATATCEVARARPDATSHERERCLERRRSELATLVRVFAAADRDIVERSVGAAAALPGVADCLDDEALRAEFARPDDEAVAQQIDREREALDIAQVEELAGRYEAAQARIEAALATAEATGFRPLRAHALLQLGRLQLTRGAHGEAEKALTDAMWDAVATRQDRRAVSAGGQLVFLLGDLMARPEDGARVAQQTWALLDRSGRPPQGEVELLTGLGNMYFRQGDYARARESLRRAIDLSESMLPQHTLQRAVNLINLSSVLDAQSEYAAGCRALAEARTIRERELGPQHPDVASVLTNLGSCHLMEGRLGEAADACERASEIWRRAFGPGFERLAFPRSTLGDIALQRARFTEAHRHFREAREIWRRALGEDHPSVTYMDERLAATFLAQGDLEAASTAANTALRAWEAAKNPDLQGLTLTLLTLADLQRARGDLAGAGASLTRAVEVATAAFGADHLISRTAEVQRADLARASGDVEPATATIVAAIASLEQRFGPRSLWLIEPLLAHGEALLTAGDDARALELATRAAAIADATEAPTQRALADFVAARARFVREPAAARSLAEDAAARLHRLGAGRHLPRIVAWLAAHA